MRKKVIVLLALSVTILCLGYIFTNASSFAICAADAYECRDLYNKVGDPLLYGMSALSFVFLALAIVPAAFNAWKKFAIWGVPLLAIIFVTYKGPSGGFMDPTPYPKQIFLWLSILYVVISLAIIASSLYKSHKKK